MKDLKVRDLECPEWADEWIWNKIVAELGDLVIARTHGSSVGVCPCCAKVHYAPVLEQEGATLNLLFDRLGVETAASCHG
jgi:hypothetical protein